ncbi:hypothetical protein JCM11251_000813 [Rhodosporidiobolus azoricus]
MTDTVPTSSLTLVPSEKPRLPLELLIKIAEFAVGRSEFDDEAGLDEALAISLTCVELRDVGQKRLFLAVESAEQVEVVIKSRRLARLVQEIKWTFDRKEDQMWYSEGVSVVATLLKLCVNLRDVALPDIPFFFLPTMLHHLSSSPMAANLTCLHLGCCDDSATNWDGTDVPLFLHALTSFRSLQSLTLDLDVQQIFPDDATTWETSLASLIRPDLISLEEDRETDSSPTSAYFPSLTFLSLGLHRWYTPIAYNLLLLLLPGVRTLELTDKGIDDTAIFRLLAGVFSASDDAALEEVRLDITHGADCRDEGSTEKVAFYEMMMRVPASVKALHMPGVRISGDAARWDADFLELLEGLGGQLETASCRVEYEWVLWRRADGEWDESDVDTGGPGLDSAVLLSMIQS